MVSSSFNAVPGLPILHSKDLVNWQLIGHVFDRQQPDTHFAKPQHGGGAWAPCIRHHKGEYYVYWADPDFGIYMSKSKDPRGAWSKPLPVKSAKGWIDPCPFWDSDGKAYLISAFAASRSGIKSVLVLSRMSSDGTQLLDGGSLVFDGHNSDPTVEGPKLYKRGGYYYIFAPAGGVTHGWQLVLRSKELYGPYEKRVVLAKGATTINGPHQGAWVDTPLGQSWFIHFQDKGLYGRVVHLQPMAWKDSWPLIGTGGNPVATHKKPNIGRPTPKHTPAESDEFAHHSIGLQWQWHANPNALFALPAPSLGVLRLFCAQQCDLLFNNWNYSNDSSKVLEEHK
jgi:beta-xylosidase